MKPTKCYALIKSDANAEVQIVLSVYTSKRAADRNKGYYQYVCASELTDGVFVYIAEYPLNKEFSNEV